MMFLAISYSVKYVEFRIFAYYIIIMTGTIINIIAITHDKHIHTVIDITTFFSQIENVDLSVPELG